MARTTRSRFWSKARPGASASTSERRRSVFARLAAFSEAEREGFEPSVGFYPYTRLAGVHLRPLGHLSRAERRHLARRRETANGCRRAASDTLGRTSASARDRRRWW